MVSLSYGQKPEWVINRGESSKYHSSVYLTGFGMCRVNNDTWLEDAEATSLDHAKKNLSEKIVVKVVSQTTYSEEEYNDEFSDDIQSKTFSSSNIEITGLQSETYYDELDGVHYTIAFVKRANLVKSYSERVDRLQREIDGLYAFALNYEQEGNTAMTLKKSLRSTVLFEEMEKYQEVLIGLGQSTPLRKDAITKLQVEELIERNKNSVANSLEDLATKLAFKLDENNGKNTPLKGVIVIPFSYEDSKTPTPFSKYFKQVLEEKLSSFVDWKISQYEDYKNSGNRDLLKYYLKGSYWVNEDVVTFTVFVKAFGAGPTLVRLEQKVDKAVITSATLEYEIPKEESIVTPDSMATEQ
ncbi:hypothetical protein GCM10023331_08120 [Algivirga pacifica]|uniref:Baseplate protein J-like domain-containing protein n=2 Tax=Algivirga pacifica TaxID=1162670 RepID=A0ABP9D6F2_9BACT